MTFFSQDSQVFLKLWMFISSSNQTCLEHAKVISYNPQKDLYNGVLHTLISDHLTLFARGFVIVK
jgi:hypothetical protein